MKYIFMNHRIRQKRPRNPVIVCQSHPLIDGCAPDPSNLLLGNASTTIESNHFDLMVGSVKIGSVRFSQRGLAACETHEVRAWVELEDGVSVVPA
jgi:hypothetical protein